MGDRNVLPIQRRPSSLLPNQTSNGGGPPRPTPKPESLVNGILLHTLDTVKDRGSSPHTRSPLRSRTTMPTSASTPDTAYVRTHRTRPPPNANVSFTKAVTYNTRTTDNQGTTTREFSPDSSNTNSSAILGGAIGGASLIAIVGIVIIFLIYRKRPRHVDNKRPLCCWASSAGDRTNSNVSLQSMSSKGNNTPIQPEMTRQQPYPNDAVDTRHGPNAYDGDSFRQENDSSHFYETVPSRGVSNRSSGYNQLNLPRINPNDHNLPTNIREGGDDTNEGSHTYLELVEYDGGYNNITNPSQNSVNDLYDHSGNSRENNYDVLQNENSLREVTPISNQQRTPVSEVNVSIRNDQDAARFPKETSCYHQYHVIELNPS